MYLTDMMTLDEVHKNTLDPNHPGYTNFNKVNCLKFGVIDRVNICMDISRDANLTSSSSSSSSSVQRVQIATVMKTIMEQQSAEYNLAPVDSIQVRLPPPSRVYMCLCVCVSVWCVGWL